MLSEYLFSNSDVLSAWLMLSAFSADICLMNNLTNKFSLIKINNDSAGSNDSFIAVLLA